MRAGVSQPTWPTVTEIRELTHPDQWRHCAGMINPADDASRGIEMEDFLRTYRWLKGQSFLKGTDENGQRANIVHQDNLEVKKEIYSTSPC